MRLKPKAWFCISLLLFAAAIGTWQYGQKYAAEHRPRQNAPPAQRPRLTKTALTATNTVAWRSSYRLSNTTQPFAQLLHNPHALLLRNALIDTEVPVALAIPAHLRAKGAPGSYLVQADRPLDRDFYAELRQAGASYISYVPNNAALVMASPTQATNLGAQADIVAVLPYDPYYKLDATLLPSAVEQQPQTNELSVTTFPGQRDAALAALTQLGATLIGEDSSPFGPALVVRVPPENLVAVAQLPLTQEIETYTPRRLMNDLTRVLMGEAPDTLIGTSNYFGLTGSNVTVNINDTGVDSTHPDLGPLSRLLGNPAALHDYDGHGTHVAGIIAGNGMESMTVPNPPFTNIPGSVPGATFQGKATNASLFVQALSLTYGPFVSDAYLQQNASVNLGPTNLISNNSWDYGDTSSYDSHAASYDAATRDAQPNVDGEQPLLFVFAAGDGGNGGANGTPGTPGTINSPATAKNVITVGTSDSPRFITNIVINGDGTTNEPFFGETSSSNLVAPFSGCGNIDNGTEGTYGRFKPDVVAPGVFTISCRSTNYVDPQYGVSVTERYFPTEVVDLHQTNSHYVFFLPTNTMQVVVQISSNAASPQPFPTNMILLGGVSNPPTNIVSSNFALPNFYTMTNFAVLTNAMNSNEFFFGVTPPTNSPGPVSYAISFWVYETNYDGNYYTVLSNMNDALQPYYRYASGTSMSAGAVSGMLALMQEFLQKRTPITNPSPALLKAMLINGSRSLGASYDFNVQPSTANEQGWGLPYLTNCVRASLTNALTPLVLVDQSPTNALATGQYQSYTISCADPNALLYPLRFTLVWTDPPGNPAAGVALVNDLDLTVSDKTGTNIYIGNDFTSGNIYTSVSNPTNLPAGQNDNTTENFYVDNGGVSNTAAGDPINNVQNVYINPAVPITFPLTVTVCGTRVNVNAVTTQTNNILQDFALVISTDDPLLADALIITTNGISSAAPVLITVASNGAPLLHERVGANEPDLYNYQTGLTNGNFSQWHFFIFTNSELTASNTTNVAFATFLPPNLSIPRNSGADIDLYVYTNQLPDGEDFNTFLTSANGLSNFAYSAVKSVGRTGTESVIFTNSTVPVYYIGVKSEDQQASDFGFYGVAQQEPFSELSNNGDTITATGTSLPVAIPTSASVTPALGFAFMVNPNPVLQMIRRVTPSVGINFPNPVDLFGTIQHNGITTILNNFTGSPGGYTNTYDDLQEDPGSGDVLSDAAPPNNLTEFINEPADGLWLLTEANSSLSLSGYITTYSVSVDLQQPQVGGPFIAEIPSGGWYDSFVYVPNDATNMTIAVGFSTGGPIGIYMTNAPGIITTSDYGTNGITAPGGYLSLSTNPPPGYPPLAGGYWFYGITNGGSGTLTVSVDITFQESRTPNLVQSYGTNAFIPLTTDGHTQSQICITNEQQIIALQVGVVITDSNLDDLVLHLTSPEGTSVDLFEDRGGLVATNLGLELVTSNGLTAVTNGSTTNYITNYVTNFVYTVFTENTNLATVPIKFAPPPFATTVYTPARTLWSNSFETVTNGVYTNSETNALTLEGWLVTNTLVTIPTTNGPGYLTNNEVGIVADVNGDQFTNSIGTVSLGTNYLALTSARIVQTFGATNPPFTGASGFAITNGMPYQLQFYAKPFGIVDWWPADDSAADIIGTNNGVISDTNVSFGVGEVDRAFTFTGVSPGNNDTSNEVDFGTNVANFGTNDFTVDFWIMQPLYATAQYGVLEKRNDCSLTTSLWDIQATNGQLFIEVSDNGGVNYVGLTNTNAPINNGVFHHAAFTRMGTNLSIYVDGVLSTNIAAPGIANISNTNTFRAGQSVCVGTAPGLNPFVGSLDELDLFNRALSPAEIYSIYHAGSLGKYNTNSLLPNLVVSIDGISTNTIIFTNASTNWQIFTNSFVANGSQVTIEYIGNTMGVLLDDIQLIQLPATNYDNYYLPEEPLTPFVGENPLGCWTLDVWDTRNDSPLPTNGTLLSWTLQLTTSSTNATLVVLTNQVGVTQTVSSNGIAYFGIDVPPYATYATNILTAISGGPLTLLFDQSALPTGGLPGDVTLTNGVAAGTASTNLLTTAGGLPPLLPGQRYFLGVVNNSGSANATFTIQVNFNISTNEIIPLTNDIPFLNVIGTNTIGTNGPEYYSFTVPPDAAMVTFQILNASNGEVDLYANEGLPVPGPDSFDYSSRNSGTNDQFIVVTTNSAPVPLQSTNTVGPVFPTTWYLAAYNPAAFSNINYTIIATVVTNGQITVIPLTNDVPYTNTAAPGYPSNIFYSFTVTNSPSGVEFLVTNTNLVGNVELLASLDGFPTADTFYAGSFNVGTNTQIIQIVPNSDLPSLNGVWYLAVPNTSDTNVIYTITALTNSIVPPPPEPLTWVGNVDDYWDILTTSNWVVTLSSPPLPYPYEDGVTVTFDDSTSEKIVNVTTAVAPANVRVLGSPYLFIGSGSINGSPLKVTGTGILTLDNAVNNFTTVNLTGTLQIGNNDTFGSLDAAGGILGPNSTFTDNGTLVFDRTDNILLTNVIAGTGSLWQIGTNTLILSGTNTYSGITLINSGTIVVDNTNALGSWFGGPVNIINGGTLDLSGLAIANSAANPLFGAMQFNISGAGAGSNGAIVNNGTNQQLGGLEDIDLTGDAAIGGGTRWDIRNGLLGLDGFTLTKVGSNQIDIVSMGFETGDIVINQGMLSFEEIGSLAPPGTITVNPGALMGLMSNPSNSFTCPIVLNGGGITNLSGSGVNFLDSTILLTNNSWIGNGAGIEMFDEPISGTFALTNLGAGSNLLAATNTYSGKTIIAQGDFGLIYNGSISNSTNIVVEPNATLDATLRFDQTFTLASNQTLFANGTVLGTNVVAEPGSTVFGNGTIISNLMLTNGTFFSPGPDGVSIGTLTVSNTAVLGGTNYFKINKTVSPSNDVLVVSNITYGGMLIVTNLNTNAAITFVVGDSFTLFNASNSSGAFLTNMILPALSNRLAWSNTFAIPGPGILIVVTNTNYIPPFPIVALTWNGDIDENWDILTTSNWLVTTNLDQPYAYQDGSVVTFDDTAFGTRTVNLTTALSPASVTVNESFYPYTFVGVGGINGAPLNLVAGMLTIDNATNSFSSVTLTSGTLQLGNDDTLGSLSVAGGILGPGTFTNGGTLAFDRSDNITITNLITGIGDLSQLGTGTLTLTAADDYAGATFVGSGTLALGTGGSIVSSQVEVAPGATLANATSIAVTIGGVTTFDSGAFAGFTAAGGIIGKIKVATNLTLNGNDVVVNVTGPALALGPYRLINCSGTLTGSAGAATLTGNVTNGYTATVEATPGVGGFVELYVNGTPVFSNLTVNPSIVYGATNITLSGVVCTTNGPATVYAANGDTVSVTINGNTVNGTVTGPNGAFSINYNDPSLPTDNVINSPYTITYAYAGNPGLFLNGATNTSTSLTVNPLPVVLTGTRYYDGTATAAASILSVSNAINSDMVTVASGSATLANSAIGLWPIVSFGTLTLGGAQAANYTLVGGSGAVAILGAPPIVPLTWNGNINGNWDILTTSNWLVTTNLATPYAYQDASTVTFDDNATGTRTVNLTTSVSPASIVVSNNLGPYTFIGVGAINGAPLTVDGTGTLTLDNATNNFSSVTLASGTLQLGNNDTLGSLAVSGGILGPGTFTDGGTLAFDRSGNITVTNVVTGVGGLSQLGTGTLTLTAADSYTNATTVAAGTLALGAGGSITVSPVTVSTGAALSNAVSTAVTIGGVTTLDPGALLGFTATTGTIGKIRVTTNLTLNNNEVIVNMTDSSLVPGNYRLINCSGTLTGSAGAGTLADNFPTGYTAAISTTPGVGGFVELTVNATPVFSNLTVNPSIPYGATNITLNGTVCTTNGPALIYAANGDPVSITINGHTVSGTITDSTGDFSINYNDPSLPTDNVINSPDTITYAYAGNSSIFLNAATDSSTALTLNPLPVVLTGSNYYDGTAIATASILSVSDVINSDVVTVASGSAILMSSNIGAEPIASFGTLTLGGAQAANYTTNGGSGLVTIMAVPPITITAVSIDSTGTNLIITWTSVPTAIYHVVASTNVGAPLNTWTKVGNSVTATGVFTSATNPIVPPFDFFEVESP